MLVVHNPRDQAPKNYPLKPGCNIIGSCLMSDIRINNKKIDPIHLVMNYKDGMLLVRDNQSDKGTFKKQKASRMNLSPNTLYEFNINIEGEEEMIFYLGDVTIEFKEQVIHQQENQHEELSDEEQKPLNNRNHFDPTLILNKEQQKPRINVFNEATQILDQNHFNNGNAVEATLVLNNDNKNFNNFAMPPPMKKKPNQFLKPVPDFNDQATQLINNNIEFGNKQKKVKFNQDFDQTLILNNNNDKKKNVIDFMEGTQILNNNNFAVVEGTQLIVNQKKQQVEFDATIVLNNNDKMNHQIDATLLINDNFKQNKVLQNKHDEGILKLLDSDDEISESPVFAKPKKRIINDSMDDIIDALDGQDNKEKKKVELSNIIEESIEEEKEQPKLPPQKFTQEKQIKEKNNKKGKQQQHPRDDGEIHGSIDDIIEEKKEEKPKQQIQSQQQKKRKRNEISNSEQDEHLSQQPAYKKLKLDNNNKLSQKGQADEQQLTILVTGDAKEPQYQKIIKQLNGKVVTDIDKEINVMVTGKLIRNAKLLYAINLGAKIVSIQWLKDSQSKAKFQDPDKYLISDKEFEKQYSCNLKNLFSHQKRNNLMQGIRVYISKNLQGLNKETMAQLITSAGGEEVNEKNKDEAQLMIIDSQKDKKLIQQYKGKKNAPHVCEVELILDGILQQKLDYKKYSLLK